MPHSSHCRTVKQGDPERSIAWLKPFIGLVERTPLVPITVLRSPRSHMHPHRRSAAMAALTAPGPKQVRHRAPYKVHLEPASGSGDRVAKTEQSLGPEGAMSLITRRSMLRS